MDIHRLPGQVPIFPLVKTILLPRRQLALNIYEERHINLVNTALKTNRLIGIIQPKPNCTSGKNIGHNSELYTIGCVGKITQFEETEEECYNITLTGMCRFSIIAETVSDGGFRQANVNWQNFTNDGHFTPKKALNRTSFLPKLKSYLTQNEMLCDKWENLKTVSDEKLVSCLSVICPLTTEEKQALLEANDIEHRYSLLEAFIDLALQSQTKHQRHH